MERSLHRQHHIIALDPGISIGLALMDWPVEALDTQPPLWESVVWTSTPVPDSLLQGWLIERGTRFVQECQFRGEPVVALIERPPQRAKEPGGAARLIAQWASDLGCVLTVYWYSPGQWKPWVRANPLPKSCKTATRHERDALSLAWYWLNVKR